jgi:hypothetical protein
MPYGFALDPKIFMHFGFGWYQPNFPRIGSSSRKRLQQGLLVRDRSSSGLIADFYFALSRQRRLHDRQISQEYREIRRSLSVETVHLVKAHIPNRLAHCRAAESPSAIPGIPIEGLTLLPSGL